MTIEEALKQLGELKFALSGTDEQFLDIIALDMAIRSLEAWQKVREELKEEMTGLDMFVEKKNTIRWCLHVIDNALGEVGESDGNSI